MTYIEEFTLKIEEIDRRTRAGLGKAERMVMVDGITRVYALRHSELVAEMRRIENDAAEQENRKPRELPFNPLNSYLLDKLTDLVLHEELTETSSNKSTKYEYPFLSEYQLSRRREGAHEQTGILQKGEVPLSAADNVGLDGKDYRYPSRKQRTVNDSLRADYATQSRNEARRKAYNDFIKPQPVKIYKAGVAV